MIETINGTCKLASKLGWNTFINFLECARGVPSCGHFRVLSPPLRALSGIDVKCYNQINIFYLNFKRISYCL
jgi:hypothetical protein